MDKKETPPRDDFVSVDSSTEMKFPLSRPPPACTKVLGEVVISCYNVCKGTL